MTAIDVLTVCQRRGVRLVISGGEMRAQGKPGAISESLRAGLAEHKTTLIDLLGDGITPDETLPDVIYFPPGLPNTVESIRAHLDALRVKVAA